VNNRPLDEDSASRLVQGLVHPDDAPPGYGAVAGLLNAAAQLPLAPVDEDSAAATVSAMVEVIRTAEPVPQTSRRKSMLGKILAGKALAAVAVIGLTATGAAAATGSLPDPVQGVVSDTVSHVGLNIPHPNHGNSADHRQDGKHDQSGDEGQSGDQSKGMSGTVEDLKGQIDDGKLEGPLGQQVCQVASKEKCHSGEANPGKGSGDDESTPPGTEGENHGQNSDDPAGQSGDDHGKDEVTPPTTPTTGSIATGEDHSGRDDLGSSNKGSSGSDH
jgi:hypothetical protein